MVKVGIKLVVDGEGACAHWEGRTVEEAVEDCLDTYKTDGYEVTLVKAEPITGSHCPLCNCRSY